MTCPVELQARRGFSPWRVLFQAARPRLRSGRPFGNVSLSIQATLVSEKETSGGFISFIFTAVLAHAPLPH